MDYRIKLDGNHLLRFSIFYRDNGIQEIARIGITGSFNGRACYPKAFVAILYQGRSRESKMVVSRGAKK